MCVRVCAPLAPRPSWGAACGAGLCGRCPEWGLPPPLPFGFFWGGASRCPWVSWSPSPHPLSFGLRLRVFLVFLSRDVCPPVLGVCPPGRPPLPDWCCWFFAGWSSGAPSGGGFGRVLWCGSAVSWLWAFLAPPPPICLFLPLPSLGCCTHWSVSVWFGVAFGACVFPGLAPAPWVGWVMYTLSSVSLPAGLGSCSAGWAVAPGGFVRP